MAETPGAETSATLPDLDEELIAQYQEQVTKNPAILPPQFQGDFKKFLESTKSLHSAFTKATQENAALRKQIEKEAAAAPAAPVAPAKPETPSIDAPPGIEIKDEPVPPAAAVFEKARSEITATGTITPDTRASLVKAGAPEEMIDFYLAKMQEERVSAQARAVSIAGSEDRKQAVVAWAKANLSEGEKAAVNAGLNSAGWETVWRGLVAKYDAAQPTAKHPAKIPGTTVGGSQASVTPFGSDAEMTAAIRDPRYRTNQDGYRDLVQARLALTYKPRQ